MANKLKLKVDIDSSKEPISPLGTMFWFRTDALIDLFNQNWKYNDFNKEPNHYDGTLLHAIERIYGFVCQNSGYYPAWLMSDKMASHEVTNLNFYLRGINYTMYDKVPMINFYYYLDSLAMINMKKKKNLRLFLRHKTKRILPKKVFKILIDIKRFLIGPRHMKGNY